jgi:MFS family permease
MQTEQQKHLRHNFTVGVIDGAFFGMAILGFSSTVTVLPLFIGTLTDSTTLIGLIASIQVVGWRLPQLLTARHVANQSHYKPMTIRVTFHERFPFFLMAAVALFATGMPAWAAVGLTFLLFGWHAVGGGLTATAWQSLIGRIMPESRRGTFFGVQSAAFSLMGALGALLAGYILTTLPYPHNYALCFFLAGVVTFISWFFLALTREPDAETLPPVKNSQESYWRGLLNILKRDHNFRWYVAAIAFKELAIIGASFYAIYSARRFGLAPDVIGLMTSLYAAVQIPFNALSGWLGDHYGHRLMLGIGAAALIAANLMAIFAPDANWLYGVWILAGVGNAILFTSSLAITLTFGQEHERPYYIGLSNTLAAPFALIAPFIGGALVDTISFSAMFLFAVISAGVMTALLARSGVHAATALDEQISAAIARGGAHPEV